MSSDNAYVAEKNYFHSNIKQSIPCPNTIHTFNKTGNIYFDIPSVLIEYLHHVSLFIFAFN